MLGSLRRLPQRWLRSLPCATTHAAQRPIHRSAEEYANDLAKDDDEAPRRLFDSFKLETIDRDIYRARKLVRGLKLRDAVYGGQVIGQALRAASDTVDDAKNPHSMHCYFIKSGTVLQPIIYLVDRVRDGKSFCTRIVKAVQNGETLFTASISFHRKEEGGMHHQQTMPVVEAPDSLLSYRQLIEKAISEDDAKPEKQRMSPHQRFMLEFKLVSTPPTFHRVFEHRPVNQGLFSFSKGHRTRYQMWVKSVLPSGNDFEMQRQMAAYVSDSAMIETAMFPHVALGFIPSMVFSLDHAVWFHKSDFSLDDWCLYEIESSYGGSCRTHSVSRLWNSGGELLLSAVQEGLVRPFDKKAASQLEWN